MQCAPVLSYIIGSAGMNRQCAMRKWFSAWLKRDGACIDEVFSEDVRYTECYGPEYLGARTGEAVV